MGKTQEGFLFAFIIMSIILLFEALSILFTFNFQTPAARVYSCMGHLAPELQEPHMWPSSPTLKASMGDSQPKGAEHSLLHIGPVGNPCSLRRGQPEEFPPPFGTRERVLGPGLAPTNWRCGPGYLPLWGMAQPYALPSLALQQRVLVLPVVPPTLD